MIKVIDRDGDEVQFNGNMKWKTVQELVMDVRKEEDGPCFSFCPYEIRSVRGDSDILLGTIDKQDIANLFHV